ncbi:endoglucanase [Butyrivibrio fibrisolvens DSM 3071]|uniref:Endoglucanase n=1 Tax=Butyrivibrio fibrisolvens DSM 3071 TaxID=1121131 RepID=A0A1M5UXA3_BUTFI|nr:glycoside hydrolase family 9 protein [Butyrivibrio fibrisolvens]SHH67518.1 endoglucanase [Butyrivibrio fibrisolvens DSM 3071]
MARIFMNQVGFKPDSSKKAVLDFAGSDFSVKDENGKDVYTGKVSHFGTDEVSGEDTYVADFSNFKENGTFSITSGDAVSTHFSIGNNVYDKLMKDICKCFYFLRCGDALTKEFAGEYYHEPCHMGKATVYGEDTEPVDVTGGWHDAGDYGRYSTAGAVAVAHILYGVRFFNNLLDVDFNIPKVKGDKGNLPDILAEVKVELDFLKKMQRENGSVWHKVTTFCHAPFVMPEEDKEELFLFHVSSLATADIAAVFALAYSIYKDYDKAYADSLLEVSKKAYKWLKENPDELLFFNAEGSNTGQYDEAEDISNRFWAAASLYEVTGDKEYYEDIKYQKDRLLSFDKNATKKGYQGNVLTCLGWAEVAGLGSLSILLKNDGDDLNKEIKKAFTGEADRLVSNAKKNGFGLCMEAKDFIWGSNMELLKYLMILTVTDKKIEGKPEYKDAITSGLDYLLGCNSMDVSYVTGNGEKAFKNPHLRPTAVDDIEEPWPGLVSGGPNVGLQDERAKEVPAGSAPMKCYLDHIDCYSLNEITIYWNSPLVFVMAGLLS